MVRQGLTVTRLEQALVDSWPTVPPADRRALVIRAVNDSLAATPERLSAALERAPKLMDRAALRHLLTKLADGCRSPLEIWGHEHVFAGPGMPAFRRQVPVRVGRRMVYLDMFAEGERVNIELDGATTHGRLPASGRSTCAVTPYWPPSGSWSSASPTAASCTTSTKYAGKPSPSWRPAEPDARWVGADEGCPGLAASGG